MCVREYEFEVPYGVVTTDQNRIVQIDEKPIHRCFINAGIYVLEPEILSVIPQNSFYDMPSLFDELIRKHEEISAFPIREYWMDIGQIDDFQRANGEFKKNFLLFKYQRVDCLYIRKHSNTWTYISLLVKIQGW